MEPLQRRMRRWSGKKMEIEKLPTLEAGEREAVLITHDESTFYCHEGLKNFWLENGKKKILPKSKGLSIMVSGFLCACHGFMSAVIDGVLLKSYKLFEASKAREGWFTSLMLAMSYLDTFIRLKIMISMWPSITS